MVGESASFEFDYTIVDTLGNESNAAHVVITINGSFGGCLVGRC